jgi:type II secretory pathway component PulJ
MKINNSGFSLLEILIYIAVIAVVSTAIGAVFLSVASGQARADAAAEINANVSFATGKINQDILLADAISQPTIAGEVSSALTLTVNATTISYCVISNRLYRSSSGVCDASSEPLTSPQTVIKNLSFTRLENINSVLPKTIVSIQTSLTAGYSGDNPDYQYSLTKQTTSSLR